MSTLVLFQLYRGQGSCRSWLFFFNLRVRSVWKCYWFFLYIKKNTEERRGNVCQVFTSEVKICNTVYFPNDFFFVNSVMVVTGERWLIMERQKVVISSSLLKQTKVIPYFNSLSSGAVYFFPPNIFFIPVFPTFFFYQWVCGGASQGRGREGVDFNFLPQSGDIKLDNFLKILKQVFNKFPNNVRKQRFEMLWFVEMLKANFRKICRWKF